MARLKKPDQKLLELKNTGTLNPHPGAVSDTLFREDPFFDSKDLLQVRYEMLRCHRVDNQRPEHGPHMAGFQLIIYGRFWVFTEANAIFCTAAHTVRSVELFGGSISKPAPTRNDIIKGMPRRTSVQEDLSYLAGLAAMTGGHELSRRIERGGQEAPAPQSPRGSEAATATMIKLPRKSGG